MTFHRTARRETYFSMVSPQFERLVRSAYSPPYGLKGSGAVRGDVCGATANCGAAGSRSIKADGGSRLTSALSPAAMPGAPKRMKQPMVTVTARRAGTRPVRKVKPRPAIQIAAMAVAAVPSNACSIHVTPATIDEDDAGSDIIPNS